MSTNTVALGKTDVKGRPAAIPQQKLARIAGLLYLVIIAAGIFAQFFARQSLIVPGDAAATAGNIMASETLFRASIAADLIMVIADVALALVFYLLFRPVSHGISLLAAFFRLIQAAMLGTNLLNLALALPLFAGTEQQQALGMLYLDAHALGYAIALAFFGISILLLGYLIFKSRYVPRIFGILLVAASAGYLLDTFARILLPNYGDYQAIFDMAVLTPAFIAELALTVWLLLKGVNVPEVDDHTSPAPALAE
jgi:hypothetical protein